MHSSEGLGLQATEHKPGESSCSAQNGRYGGELASQGGSTRLLCQPKVTASLTRGQRCTEGFEFGKEEKTMKISGSGTKVSSETQHHLRPFRKDSGTGDTEDPRGPFHSVRALL